MTHRLYTSLAYLWPHLAERDSHAIEAVHLQELFDEARGQHTASILELGCGGANIAAHFDATREVILTDLSADMLQVARQNNPGRQCIIGDMRSLTLDRTVDAVLLHDSVMYLTTEADLTAAIQTAATLLKPGGVLLIVPDAVKEHFVERSAGGGTLGEGGVQLLEWHWDPDPSDTTHQLDISLLYRDASGTMQSMHESHTLGLFPSAIFVQSIRSAGLLPVEHLVWDDTLFPEVFAALKTPVE